MLFRILRPFKYKGKLYCRGEKYIEMPYEDARIFIIRRQMFASKTQESDPTPVRRKRKPSKRKGKKAKTNNSVKSKTKEVENVEKNI